jgi:hypothetical protein
MGGSDHADQHEFAVQGKDSGCASQVVSAMGPVLC